MSRLTILDNISIASPCDADWAEMLGDERTRFCASCSKHVYNISEMTAEEATSLIVESEGKLCARIYRRADGTILTADCPVGRGRISAGRRLRRALAAGLVVPGLMVAGVAAMGYGTREIEPFPSGPGVTWDDCVDWALVTLGLRTRPVVFAGAMSFSPSLFPPSPSGSTPNTPLFPDDEGQSPPPPIPTPIRPEGASVMPVAPGSPAKVSP